MRFSSVSIVYGITLSQADTSNTGVVRNIDVTFDIKIHCQPKTVDWPPESPDNQYHLNK